MDSRKERQRRARAGWIGGDSADFGL